MIGLKRVFGYLKKWIKGTTLIDPNYPDHSQFPTEAYDQWKEFYPDAEEPMPAKDMLLEPLGDKIQITAYTDSDHAHDLVTRRSVTGVLLFLNDTLVKAISQRKKTVETSTYGSELVATRVATKRILEYRNTLHLIGVELDGPALLLGDNNSVVLNCTMPHSVLKKMHAACNYHRVRKTIVGGAMVFSHISSEYNFADILTKPLSGPAFRNLVKPLLFRVPKEE